MKPKRSQILLALIAMLVMAALFWLKRRSDEHAMDKAMPRPELPAVGPLHSTQEIGQAKISASVSPAVLTSFCDGINRFIAAAEPFGLNTPIRPEQLISVRTNWNGKSVLMDTRAHLFELQGKRLVSFISKLDGVHTRLDPSARSRWYQASARWTEQEAIQETYSILQRLGLRAQIARNEYEPFTLHVNNAAGESVLATPFHTVRLYNTNDTMIIEAQFRMSASGPGRLVRWWTNLPP